MYNYRITRLSYLIVFRLLFCAGVALGGLGGIMLGSLERDAVGVLGGMFLGLVFGLLTSIAGLFYVYVFNIMAPILGGLPIQLEAITNEEATPAEAAASYDNAAEPPAQDT